MIAARIMLAAALLAGCSLLAPPKPEPVKAVLSQLPQAIPHARRHAASLLVLTPDVSPAFDSVRMAYTERPYQIAYFRDHEWAEPPAPMLQKLLVQVMERSGAFRSVLTPPEPARGGFTLRTELRNLVQDYTVTPPVLRLALRVQLLGASGQPIASHDVAEQVPMREAKPYAGVGAANAAMATALQEIAAFVLEHAR